MRVTPSGHLMSLQWSARVGWTGTETDSTDWSVVRRFDVTGLPMRRSGWMIQTVSPGGQSIFAVVGATGYRSDDEARTWTRLPMR